MSSTALHHLIILNILHVLKRQYVLVQEQDYHKLVIISHIHDVSASFGENHLTVDFVGAHDEGDDCRSFCQVLRKGLKVDESYTTFRDDADRFPGIRVQIFILIFRLGYGFLVVRANHGIELVVYLNEVLDVEIQVGEDIFSCQQLFLFSHRLNLLQFQYVHVLSIMDNHAFQIRCQQGGETLFFYDPGGDPEFHHDVEFRKQILWFLFKSEDLYLLLILWFTHYNGEE